MGARSIAMNRAASKEQAPSVLGVSLGKSTISDVVYILGSPKSLYLAGEDSEGSAGKANDPLVLRYETDFPLAKKHRCHARVFSEPRSYVVNVISISFVDAKAKGHSEVSKSEVEAVYGLNYRTVHRRIEYDDGGTEATVGKCDDPHGEVESLLYSELGLEVWLENKTQVQSLRFSFQVWSGMEKIERCADSR